MVTGTEYKGEHNHPMPGCSRMGSRQMRPPKNARVDAAAVYMEQLAQQQMLGMMDGNSIMINGLPAPVGPSMLSVADQLQLQGFMGGQDLQQQGSLMPDQYGSEAMDTEEQGSRVFGSEAGAEGMLRMSQQYKDGCNTVSCRWR
eukprot:GHRR01024375.1.p1 GENE.GHRR01024375.1~~GHRR01024375.1.p1  ORF type:complete len:144 (+),score=66.69 GHRR01024375.1:729-1160(+)